MHDIKSIRDNPQAFDEGLAKRGLPEQAKELLALDDTRRGLIARLQALQERIEANHGIWIVLESHHQHADPPHPVALLRPCPTSATPPHRRGE